MNSRNSKTSDPHRLLLNLEDKINLKRSDKYIALSNLRISCTWKNLKKAYQNSKFKISALTWNEEFELPDGSYSVLDIQNYFDAQCRRPGTSSRSFYDFVKMPIWGDLAIFNSRHIPSLIVPYSPFQKRKTLESWHN